MLEYFGQWDSNINIQDKKIRGRLVVLPMPPSENERLITNWDKAKEVVAGGYYANFNGKTKKGAVTNSRLYNQWLHASAHLLMKGKLTKLQGNIGVIIVEVFPDNRRRDADNRIKGLFDAMTKSNHMFDDDSQIVFFTCEKRVIPHKSFVLAFVFNRDEAPELWTDVNKSFVQKIAETIPAEKE